MADRRRLTGTSPVPRKANRHCVSVPARLTWKDASGAVRFVSVMTRDVSDAGAFVECDGGAAIPLHRLVHVQIERSMRGPEHHLPERLREGRVLSAVWRVAACSKSTGTPSGYALRFLVDPGATISAVTLAEPTAAIAV